MSMNPHEYMKREALVAGKSSTDGVPLLYKRSEFGWAELGLAPVEFWLVPHNNLCENCRVTEADAMRICARYASERVAA